MPMVIFEIKSGLLFIMRNILSLLKIFLLVVSYK